MFASIFLNRFFVAFRSDLDLAMAGFHRDDVNVTGLINSKPTLLLVRRGLTKVRNDMLIV